VVDGEIVGGSAPYAAEVISAVNNPSGGGVDWLTLVSVSSSDDFESGEIGAEFVADDGF
jgi:hypothetical protein